MTLRIVLFIYIPLFLMIFTNILIIKIFDYYFNLVVYLHTTFTIYCVL